MNTFLQPFRRVFANRTSTVAATNLTCATFFFAFAGLLVIPSLPLLPLLASGGPPRDEFGLIFVLAGGTFAVTALVDLLVAALMLWESRQVQHESTSCLAAVTRRTAFALMGLCLLPILQSLPYFVATFFPFQFVGTILSPIVRPALELRHFFGGYILVNFSHPPFLLP